MLPQFILRWDNVIADALSRANQVIGSEWTLHQEAFDSLNHRWPVTVDLFATNLNFRCQVFFAPLRDPLSVGTNAFLQNWTGLQAFAFPPFELIRKVLNKVRESIGLESTLIAPYRPQKEWFPDLLEVSLESPVQLPLRSDLRQPHFHCFHPGLPSLFLHAWRLSGSSPNMKDSLGR